MMIGLIMLEKEKFDDALKIMKKLVMMFPHDLMFRYYLAFVVQRLSEKYLDAENRETATVCKSIVFIKKIKALYMFLSKVKIDTHVNYIANMEMREKVKEKISEVRERSDDQKMYLKSR